MIEEKLTIDFKEYISFFKEESAEFEFCRSRINAAIDNFLSGATTVAHHGFNLYGKDFHAELGELSFDDDNADWVTLNISNTFDSTLSADFSFDATLKLVMTKTNNCVVIDCE